MTVGCGTYSKILYNYTHTAFLSIIITNYDYYRLSLTAALMIPDGVVNMLFLTYKGDGAVAI